jgi:nucleoside-diphosphate-sugar epimerase
MRWLILGGTRFLGRHLAGMALARGDAVTLVHRGRQRENLFPQADHRIGDRTSELERLLGGPGGPTWDAVIDTSAYFPRQVSSAARVLAGRVGHYTLVSTISVYGEIDTPGIDETAPTPAPAAPTVEEVTGDTYGPLKAACEQAAQAGFAGRTLVVRPGLIVGPHDPSGRFTWWLQRVQRGGELLAPGRPDDAVQFIDARDPRRLDAADGRAARRRHLQRHRPHARDDHGPAAAHRPAGAEPGRPPALGRRRHLAGRRHPPLDRAAAVAAGPPACPAPGRHRPRAGQRPALSTAGGHRARHRGLGLARGAGGRRHRAGRGA